MFIRSTKSFVFPKKVEKLCILLKLLFSLRHDLGPHNFLLTIFYSVQEFRLSQIWCGLRNTIFLWLFSNNTLNPRAAYNIQFSKCELHSWLCNLFYLYENFSCICKRFNSEIFFLKFQNNQFNWISKIK